MSKYAGDIDKNVTNAIFYCKFVINEGFMPVASHLLYPQILNDNVSTERKRGCDFGLDLLSLCNEVWVFGKEFSVGMKSEIAEAIKLEKTIKYFDEKCLMIR